MRLQALLIMLLTVPALFAARPAAAGDNALLPATQSATGRLVLTGSTTLSNLLSLWVEAFHQYAPAVSFTVADPGSALRGPGLRAVSVARRNGEPAIAPTTKAIRSGHYPLARTLVIACNLPPGHEITSNLRAFLDFARSAQGQTIAAKAGYVELSEFP